MEVRDERAPYIQSETLHATQNVKDVSDAGSGLGLREWIHMLSALIEYMNATCRSRPLLLEDHECL